MLALSAGKEVQRRLGSPHHLVDWRELNQNLFRALEFQKVLIALILVIIIVVAAFNIVSSLTMIVLSKTREVAILKSMGGTSRMVARVFLIGGTTVGMMGTSLGIGYGLLVCMLARFYGYSLDPKVYLIGELPVQLRPRGAGRRRGRDARHLVGGDAVSFVPRQPHARRRRAALDVTAGTARASGPRRAAWPCPRRIWTGTSP